MPRVYYSWWLYSLAPISAWRSSTWSRCIHSMGTRFCTHFFPVARRWRLPGLPSMGCLLSWRYCFSCLSWGSCRDLAACSFFISRTIFSWVPLTWLGSPRVSRLLVSAYFTFSRLRMMHWIERGCDCLQSFIVSGRYANNLVSWPRLRLKSANGWHAGFRLRRCLFFRRCPLPINDTRSGFVRVYWHEAVQTGIYWQRRCYTMLVKPRVGSLSGPGRCQFWARY